MLKPQKEGGANNFYGTEIIDCFKTMSFEQLQSFILMEKIKSCPR